MRRALERAIDICGTAARGWTVLVLATALLATAEPARAKLIGSPVSYPDLTVSYLDVVSGSGGISAASSSLNPYLDLFLSPVDDIFLTGSYLLSYDEASHTGRFSVQGTFEATLESFWLSGDIVGFGNAGDGKAYDFLVKLDAIDPALSAYGFGGVGSLIYTDLLRNGDVWQSDTVPAPVPEPASLLLVGTGLVLAALWRRRQQ